MIYRTEHPKPQFMRTDWVNLNGEWQFETDSGVSGKERGLHLENAVLSGTVTVPFCPESKLSGVGNTDFMNSLWYKREFEIDKSHIGSRIILHFGAVDYEAYIYINGNLCRTHRGGYVSFSVDITQWVREGTNTLTVNALDNTRDGLIPSGKQSERYDSYGCFYTRTTGIWQTVWMEFVPQNYIKSTRYITDVGAGTVTIEAKLEGEGVFKAEAFFDGKFMGDAHTESYGGSAVLTIELAEKHLWEIGKGGLYDLVLTYGEDKVQSYFGLRSVTLDGYKFLINGKRVFQRLVLDQGFYPDGIYTAPSDKELEADIDRSLAMGFNGARLHEKVFEERFLYHCDRKGYIVWGEYPNWGLDLSRADSVFSILPEWLEEVERDFNHPAIVGWCPFNETHYENERRQIDDVLKMVYLATKAVDATRPCIDTSGWYHVQTDIYDVHDYQQNPEIFAERYGKFAADDKYFEPMPERQKYTPGMPLFVSEYGGIAFARDEKGWGYGDAPESREEFLSRLKGLTDVLLGNKYMFGFCYTQLTDVEQEQNGLYTYDRKPKFDPKEIYPIFSAKAAFED